MKKFVHNKNSIYHLPRVAVVDDNVLVRISWEFSIQDAVICSFPTPEAFLSRGLSDPNFMKSFDYLVIDQYYAQDSSMTGLGFAKNIRHRFFGKIILTSQIPLEEKQLIKYIDSQVIKDSKPIKFFRDFLTRAI